MVVDARSIRHLLDPLGLGALPFFPLPAVSLNVLQLFGRTSRLRPPRAWPLLDATAVRNPDGPAWPRIGPQRPWKTPKELVRCVEMIEFARSQYRYSCRRAAIINKKDQHRGSNSQKETQLLLGLDDGHETNKVCFGWDDAAKAWRYQYYKSRAVECLPQVMSMGGADSAGVAYGTAGGRFTVAGSQNLL